MRISKRLLWLAALAAIALVLGQQWSARAQRRSIPVRVHATELGFAPAPNMPPGVQIAVLEGDPKKAGLFTLRLKAPAGFVLPPHTHPVDERVTVLSGSVLVGLGTVVDKTQAERFVSGDFYINPPGLPHFVMSEEGATIQITGQGPWKVALLNK